VKLIYIHVYDPDLSHVRLILCVAALPTPTFVHALVALLNTQKTQGLLLCQYLNHMKVIKAVNFAPELWGGELAGKPQINYAGDGGLYAEAVQDRSFDALAHLQGFHNSQSTELELPSEAFLQQSYGGQAPGALLSYGDRRT
jgi:hypothetical protein